jgi:hypothetical protein
MKRICQTAVILLALAAFLSHTRGAHAQTPPREPAGLVTKARVAKDEGAYSGPLYVTIRAREKKIADEAVEAWVIQGGHSVVYSGRDGAGGFENEGESLRIYDARTGKQRKIMSEYFEIDKVTEVTTSAHQTALLVELVDGGLGASYVAVVNPLRGEVFFRRWVRIVSRRGDVVVLGHYKEDDWEKLSDENEKIKVKPYKTERLNLNDLLKRRVIVNKRDS